MNNSHTFKINNENFLFLPEYKQVYKVPENEVKLINGTNDKSKEILEKYIKPLEKVKEIAKEDIRTAYSLYLNVANMCNAACIYCFANQGNYGKADNLMRETTALEAIDYFFDKVPDECHISIMFFGGEPLLSFGVIKKVCEYLKEKYSDRDYGLSITTNGTLLTKKIIDFFEEYKVKVAMSIDGGENVQNNQRPLKNGDNCYAEATKNIEYLFSKKIKNLARGTYYDLSVSLADCYKELISLGFKEVDIIPDMLDINDVGKVNKLLSRLDELYEYILKYCENHDDFPFGTFVTRIRHVFIPLIISEYACGIGKYINCIDTLGNIYPCHRFSSDPEYLIGNLKDEKHIDPEFRFADGQCRMCWNRYTCTHGCAYEDKHLDASMKKNIYLCMYQKKMTELAIALSVKLKESTLEKILSFE